MLTRDINLKTRGSGGLHTQRCQLFPSISRMGKPCSPPHTQTPTGGGAEEQMEG